MKHRSELGMETIYASLRAGADMPATDYRFMMDAVEEKMAKDVGDTHRTPGREYFGVIVPDIVHAALREGAQGLSMWFESWTDELDKDGRVVALVQRAVSASYTTDNPMKRAVNYISFPGKPRHVVANGPHVFAVDVFMRKYIHTTGEVSVVHFSPASALLYADEEGRMITSMSSVYFQPHFGMAQQLTSIGLHILPREWTTGSIPVAACALSCISRPDTQYLTVDEKGEEFQVIQLPS